MFTKKRFIVNNKYKVPSTTTILFLDKASK